MAPKTILLGEDEADIAAMYQTALTQAGFIVAVAANGQEVIGKIKSARPDLILLDINMPGKDGFEVLRDISENADLYQVVKTVPIVMLTNYSNQQDVEYALKMGAQDYLVKSEWTMPAIIEKVKKYLDDD